MFLLRKLRLVIGVLQLACVYYAFAVKSNTVLSVGGWGMEKYKTLYSALVGQTVVCINRGNILHSGEIIRHSSSPLWLLLFMALIKVLESHQRDSLLEWVLEKA